jgi:hypothetical protein
MSTNIREVSYVCNPRNLSVKVEYLPLRAGNQITLYIDNAAAFSKVFRAPPTSRLEDIHRFVQNYCEMFFRHLNEEDFAAAVPDKDYLRAKYIHQTIRAVYSKMGILVWKR